MSGSETLIDLGLSLLALIAPVLASVLTAMLVKQLKTWGLTLESEQEAKIQAKILQLVLAIEEQARRERKMEDHAMAKLGGTLTTTEAEQSGLRDFDTRIRVRQNQTRALAQHDRDLAALSDHDLLTRADAALTRFRQGRVA